MTADEPIPIELLRREFRELLSEHGMDPDTVKFEVSHADYFGRFDGEMKTVKVAVVELEDGMTFQFFPKGLAPSDPEPDSD